MRYRFLFLVVVLVGLVASTAYGGISVFFSPHGGCDQALIQLAHSAHIYLDAACYTFTLDTVVGDELIAAEERGVRVRVILDHSQGVQRWSQTSRLLHAGIPVKVNTHSGLMHDKFLVADGNSVATGSFNWTKAAVERNDENLVVFTDEPRIAATFAAQFEKMWTDTARFAAFFPGSATKASTAAPTVAQPQPNLQESADTVYMTKTGTKYHRAGCRYLARSSIPISRKEAEARGYAPCKVCKP